MRPGIPDRLDGNLAGHLPAKHRELVTQDEYLDLVRGL
jgi:hypothetical protein